MLWWNLLETLDYCVKQDKLPCKIMPQAVSKTREVFRNGRCVELPLKVNSTPLWFPLCLTACFTSEFGIYPGMELNL